MNLLRPAQPAIAFALAALLLGCGSSRINGYVAATDDGVAEPEVAQERRPHGGGCGSGVVVVMGGRARVGLVGRGVGGLGMGLIYYLGGVQRGLNPVGWGRGELLFWRLGWAR